MNNEEFCNRCERPAEGQDRYGVDWCAACWQKMLDKIARSTEGLEIASECAPRSSPTPKLGGQGSGTIGEEFHKTVARGVQR